MSRTGSSYADTCEVFNVNTERSMHAEVLNFRPGKVLSVSINRQVKITMQYDKNKDLYIGRTGSMEFLSDGPEETYSNRGRGY